MKIIYIVVRDADIVGVFDLYNDALVYAWSSAFDNCHLLHSVHAWDIRANRQNSQTDLMCESAMASLDPASLDAAHNELLQTRAVPVALSDYMHHHRYV